MADQGDCFCVPVEIVCLWCLVVALNQRSRLLSASRSVTNPDSIQSLTQNAAIEWYEQRPQLHGLRFLFKHKSDSPLGVIVILPRACVQTGS